MPQILVFILFIIIQLFIFFISYNLTTSERFCLALNFTLNYAIISLHWLKQEGTT